MNQSIIFQKVTFPVNERTLEVSLSFGVEKTGIVGKNGTGKTTLLRLLMRELEPVGGVVAINTELAYLPQDYQFNLEQTVAEALGIRTILEAIVKLKQDSQNQELLRVVGTNWDIEARALGLLQGFGFEGVVLSKKLSELSGGERMKVVLAGLFIFLERFIVMDEPTNNLDAQAREVLYRYIANWKHGMLVVSHDRKLLELVDQIAEVSPKGVSLYGGNYEYYETQKQAEKDTAQRQFTTAQQEFKKIKKQAQAVRERQEKRVSHAKKHAATQNIPKIILNAMKRSGEETAGMLRTMHDERVAGARERLSTAKENIPQENQIHVDLSNTEVPKGKCMVEVIDVSFDYADTQNLISNISFSIYGQERIAIAGPNGSGKTTLINLLLKNLTPKQGSILIGTERVAYLDQVVAVLNSEQTVLENVVRISELPTDEAREWLSGFLFFGKDVFKKVKVLSGGERIRAGLAAILAGIHPAQLLILDEPTNNLDLDSIQQLESALMNYRGNLLVISHDQVFLNAIGIERYISL